MKSVITIAAIALLWSVQAIAQDMPRFDVEAHCEEIAEFGGGSHQIYNGCIQMEQGAYNTLKGRWANVSARIRNHCVDIAQFGGGSYQILHGCVQMEEDAAGNRQSFSFD